MTTEEKYKKLVSFVKDLYEDYWDKCPDASDIENLDSSDPSLMKVRTLGMFMALETINDYIDDELERQQ